VVAKGSSDESAKAVRRSGAVAKGGDRRAQRFTERYIDGLNPIPGERYVAWDAELKGFGVRVSPEGTKTFLLKYRLPSGRVRWKTLGRVGKVSLDKARRFAKDDVGVVARGDDPQGAQDAARAAFTVGQVAEKFLSDFIDVRRKPATRRLYRLALDRYILPALRSVPIGDVSHADAVRLHEKLRESPVMANRVIATLSSLLSWSMKGKGRYRPIGINPCVGIEKFDEQPRARYLTAEEYAKVGRALRTMAMSPGPRAALQLLLLTGARPAEIASLQWAHVDLDRAELNLPDSKTGAKTIHLAPAAVQVLKDWPQHVGSPYVFPGAGQKVKGEHLNPSTLTHLWGDLRATIGLDDVRLYDAGRHSYASEAVSRHGLTLPQIGAQLGHSQPSTTARYAHLHNAVAKQHANVIGTSIAAALRKRVPR
jgi:integrase